MRKILHISILIYLSFAVVSDAIKSVDENYNIYHTLSNSIIHSTTNLINRFLLAEGQHKPLVNKHKSDRKAKKSKPLHERISTTLSFTLLYDSSSLVNLSFDFLDPRYKEVPFNYSYHKSVPSVASLTPNMTYQVGPGEENELKFHVCIDGGEAYGASYLVTKEYLLRAMKLANINVTWVNCEMASFLLMRGGSGKKISQPYSDGMMHQTLDILDFAAIHLSTYERCSKKYKDVLWKDKADRHKKWREIPVVRSLSAILETLINPNISKKSIVWSSQANRTVAIMPFLGGAMGAGHSELANRYIYLRACFWSLYQFMPHIVAGVTRQSDVDWIRNQSGLPFYDVFLLDALPKSASLPVSTVKEARRRLLSGEWDFDYVFYTESDQVLIWRTQNLSYHYLDRHPGIMLIPHRLMAYPDSVIHSVHKREEKGVLVNGWMNQSCCLPRQNCVERASWVSLKQSTVPVINYYGLKVPLGNSNFLDEVYRACTLGPFRNWCP